MHCLIWRRIWQEALRFEGIVENEIERASEVCHTYIGLLFEKYQRVKIKKK